MSQRFRLVDLFVVIGAVAVVGVPLTFAVQAVSTERDRRISCASNLRQIGQAIMLYANENKGAYPRVRYNVDAAAKGPIWGTPYKSDKSLGAASADDANPFAKDDAAGVKYRPEANDITAALYLLMRTQEIASPAFVCPSTGQQPYGFGGGDNTALNFTNWPGTEMLAKHLSYSYANPYPTREAVAAGYRMNTALPEKFVVAADMNSGSKELLTLTNNSPQDKIRAANSLNHNREGQNVLYADGSVAMQLTPFAGLNGDNIYTFGSGDKVGILGSPIGSEDSVLLPTSADLGVTDFPNRPPDLKSVQKSPEELKKLKAQIVGQFTMEVQGRQVTLTIGETSITIESGSRKSSMPYSLMATTDPNAVFLTMNTPQGEGVVTALRTAKGIQLEGFGALSGEWTRK